MLFWGFIVCATGQTLVYASIAEMASMYVKDCPFRHVGYAGHEIADKVSANRSPTAGGQYHWVSEFAPPRWQKQLSYLSGKNRRLSHSCHHNTHWLVGWLTAIGWQVYLASVCFLVGTIIQGLIILNDPTYVHKAWHGTLLSIAIVFFSIIFNTALASRLPLIG